MPIRLSNQTNRFLLRAPSMVASAILANTRSAVGNGSMRRPHSHHIGCASSTIAGSDVAIVTREIGTDGAHSVVVVLALEKVQRRGYLAHHDHDRLGRCLDGPGLGQVADDTLDVGEKLALPFAQALHVPARLRVSKL